MLGCTLRELGSRLPAEEFFLWWAYYLIEPWGFHANDWHAGVVASSVANFSGHIKRPVQPQQFMRDLSAIRVAQGNAEEQFNQLRRVLN